jgi:hypothetical protein
MPEITLESGSAAHRFALHLLAKPAAYPRQDVAALLKVAPGAVDGLLQPAVDQGLVTIGADADLGGRVWRAGPRLSQWQAAGDWRGAAIRPDAPAAAPAAAKPAPRGGRRLPLPKLDVAKLRVVTGAALPNPQISRKGATRYDDVLDMLKVDGTSVQGGIGVAYQAALQKAVVSYLKARPQLKARSTFYVRRLEDKPNELGIWRVARDGPDAQARSRDAGGQAK